MIRVSHAFNDGRHTAQQTISEPSAVSKGWSAGDKVKFLRQYQNVILDSLSTEKVNQIEGPQNAI